MHPTFATSVYNRTKSTVESRVNSRIQETLRKYDKKLQALDSEKKAGKYQFDQRIYEQKKGKIMRNLKTQTDEIQKEADRYMSTMGLKEKTLSASQRGSPTSMSQIGMRSWTRSAAGGRLKGLFPGLGAEISHSPDLSSDWSPFLGYIGPPSAKGYNAAMEMSVSGRLERSREGEKGQCFKLSLSPKSYDSIQQALLYLKLRSDGCSKEKSMVYSVKRRCMTDSTMTKDGPACHRTIRLGDNRVTGPNWKGWQLHPPKLKVEKQYQPVEENLDQQEYELLAKEFERLTDKQDRQREGMDFDESDKDRERYFHALQMEWGKRLRKKKVNSPVLLKPRISIPLVNISIPVIDVSVKSVLSETPKPVQISLEATPEPQSPGMKEEIVDPDLSTKESLPETELKESDPAKIEEFEMGSIIIRNVVPRRVTNPPKDDRRRLTRKMTIGLGTIREDAGELGNAISETPDPSQTERIRAKTEDLKESKTDLKRERQNCEEILHSLHQSTRVSTSATEIRHQANGLVSLI